MVGISEKTLSRSATADSGTDMALTMCMDGWEITSRGLRISVPLRRARPSLACLRRVSAHAGSRAARTTYSDSPIASQTAVHGCFLLRISIACASLLGVSILPSQGLE